MATYGGTEIREQISALRNGIEIVVAAPGRLWDLIERKAINLSTLKVTILLTLDFDFRRNRSDA